MELLLNLLLILIALLHALFMLLEMVLWDKPVGRKIFGLSESFAQQSRALAANQGLYNGFLVAGLIWSIVSGLFSLQLFFLSCVFIAGMFGAMTVSRRIFWIQAMPAILALLLLFQVH